MIDKGGACGWKSIHGMQNAHMAWWHKTKTPPSACSALPCPALPCPALPCPALPCPALPCPALPTPPPGEKLLSWKEASAVLQEREAAKVAASKADNAKGKTRQGQPLMVQDCGPPHTGPSSTPPVPRPQHDHTLLLPSPPQHQHDRTHSCCPLRALACPLLQAPSARPATRLSRLRRPSSRRRRSPAPPSRRQASGGRAPPEGGQGRSQLGGRLGGHCRVGQARPPPSTGDPHSLVPLLTCDLHTSPPSPCDPHTCSHTMRLCDYETI